MAFFRGKAKFCNKDKNSIKYCKLEKRWQQFFKEIPIDSKKVFVSFQTGNEILEHLGKFQDNFQKYSGSIENSVHISSIIINDFHWKLKTFSSDKNIILC